MADNNLGSKRTRSQLALSDNILHLPLTRSPLKDARTALRTQFQPLPQTPRRATSTSKTKTKADDTDDSEDEILLSPRKRSQLKQQESPASSLGTKRPSSPDDDVLPVQVHVQTPGPERKRPRRDGPASDGEDARFRSRQSPTRVFSAPSMRGLGTGVVGSDDSVLSSSLPRLDLNVDAVLPASPHVEVENPNVDGSAPSVKYDAEHSTRTGGEAVEIHREAVESIDVDPPEPANTEQLEVTVTGVISTPASITSITHLSPLTPLPETPFRGGSPSKDQRQQGAEITQKVNLLLPCFL
jgi:hypothetical protein